MLAKVHSAALHGIDAVPVEVEVDHGFGQSAMILVGLPDTAVRESRDRVVTAMNNSGYRFSFGRTTINLAPADLRKEGPSFDLPIALGLLVASEQIEVTAHDLGSVTVVGELALTGEVRPVKGALAIAVNAQATGKKTLLVPAANAREAAVVQGIDVLAIENLRQAADWMEGVTELEPVRVDLGALFAGESPEMIDMNDVRGQETAKRALEVAAAGGHNLLLIGPPGTGKSMLAKRLATILPPLTLEEALETTQIHSACGLVGESGTLVTRRPFRSPHHTASDAGLLGGNAQPSPGEISLAHHGVLFLDELPEFKRTVLETLRQPLEDGKVTISRAAGTMTFPARFMLVAAMNPTPDGRMPAESRSSPRDIQNYRARVSGPLLDRIDLHVEMPAVRFSDMSRAAAGESSSVIRQRVLEARERQRQRFAGRAIGCNAAMGARELREFVKMSGETQEMLRSAMTDMDLSARAHDRILKVARTIADLEGVGEVNADHLDEAIRYRSLDRSLWH